MRYGLPLALPGQSIGLLGGSFDPPHAGHVHIAREALRRFALDQVWFLVSPGNPLKPRGPAPLEQRMDEARTLIRHPRMHVSDFEARAGTRYTAETLDALHQVTRGLNFVWLMGADNMVQFNRWDRWRGIIETVPLGVLARPGQRISARNSVAARVYRAARIPAARSQALARAEAPAWCFVNVPMLDISSTALRAAGARPGAAVGTAGTLK